MGIRKKYLLQNNIEILRKFLRSSVDNTLYIENFTTLDKTRRGIILYILTKDDTEFSLINISNAIAKAFERKSIGCNSPLAITVNKKDPWRYVAEEIIGDLYNRYQMSLTYKMISVK